MDIGEYEISGIPTAEKYNLTSAIPRITTRFSLTTNGTIVVTRATANITVHALKKVGS